MIFSNEGRQRRRVPHNEGRLLDLVRLSIRSLVALVRAAYEAGGGGYDPYEDVDSVPLSDGDALRLIVNHVGNYESIFYSQRVMVAAIRGEVAGVMEELRSGALLSIGDGMRGRDLSEAFSALVYDLLLDQIEQTEGGGIQS